jgi:hypothetical protein
MGVSGGSWIKIYLAMDLLADIIFPIQYETQFTKRLN